MAKHSFKASIGLNIGIFRAQVEYGIEWEGNAAPRPDDRYTYLKEIRQLKREVAHLSNRLAVFESHTPVLLGFRSNNQAGFHRLLERSDRIAQSNNLDVGLVLLPQINYRSAPRLALDSVSLHRAPVLRATPTCKVQGCHRTASVGEYCTPHVRAALRRAIQQSGRYVPGSPPENPLFEKGAAKPTPAFGDLLKSTTGRTRVLGVSGVRSPVRYLAGQRPITLDPQKFGFGHCKFVNCKNWALKGEYCTVHKTLGQWLDQLPARPVK